MVNIYNQIIKKENITKLALVSVALTFAVTMVIGMFSTVSAAKPDRSTTIQGGEITDSTNVVIGLGFDEWGYNYQGHMFSGKYCDSYRDAEWCWPYRDVNLSMKWNDAWISNQDMDDDQKLDRHHGFDTYIGSGAWLTNHQSGEYEQDGETIKWTYFVKIVAAPADAYPDGGTWYTADDVEIGAVIWGQFAVVQEVSNDPGADQHGAQYVSPFAPGFGVY